MTTIVSPGQATELSRLAARCGRVALRQLERGHVAVGISPTAGGATVLALALDDRGHVVAHRRLRRAPDASR